MALVWQSIVWETCSFYGGLWILDWTRGLDCGLRYGLGFEFDILYPCSLSLQCVATVALSWTRYS